MSAKNKQRIDRLEAEVQTLRAQLAAIDLVVRGPAPVPIAKASPLPVARVVRP